MSKPIYSRFRHSLSRNNRGRLTRFLINTGIKPTVNRKVKSPFVKGIVIFSADFEMAWAFRFSKKNRDKAIQKGLAERENIPVLLKLFDKHKIPVTWATVGHLFLDSCMKDESGYAHSDLPRPDFFENRNWEYNSGDWYKDDPCSDYKKDPAWYASDLIEMITNSQIKHEIGCHTFSHIDFSYKNCSSQLANAELQICKKVAEMRMVSLKSMVFPGGTFGNYEVLKQNEFQCYRKPMQYHIDLPYEDKYGLIAIPSSLGLDKDPYGWGREFHLKMIRKYLEKAVKYRLLAHFWFHPSMDRWYLEVVMPEVLKMIAHYADSGNLDINTMTQTAEKFRSLIGNR